MAKSHSYYDEESTTFSKNRLCEEKYIFVGDFVKGVFEITRVIE